ncbi:MAG: phosphotransferase [Pseudomonadaceae bacterium]|nr:phosphotransferase [Pseudomonadaceae bacterium]
MDRSERINTWLKPWLTTPTSQLTNVAGDASFRSYYRITAPQSSTGSSLILMDAPPDKENSHSFISLAKAWHQRGIKVPNVLAYDLTLGVALLEDFGDTQLMQRIQAQPTEADAIYRQALEQLIGLQQLPSNLSSQHPLPHYCAALLAQELALFDDWLITGLLKLAPATLPASWPRFKQQLITSALEQPQVTVHRDYHSRNLMVLTADSLATQQLGIIDFQDAVYGPCTYDAVSLIRDCYINWPAATQQAWLAYFHQLYCQQAATANLEAPVSLEEFQRWFDWMGMQRHIKVAGIFARLWLRDNKAGYLQDIPLTLQHLLQATQHYPELADINDWLAKVVIPAFNVFLQQRQQGEENGDY